MINKGSKLYSIVYFKCPYCHEGDFFKSHPYDLKQVGDIHANCPVCNRRYSIEPGFYYGAMFVSYALGVALSIASYLLLVWAFPTLGMVGQILTIGGVMLLAGPYIYALSKILWANIFYHYQGPPTAKP